MGGVCSPINLIIYNPIRLSPINWDLRMHQEQERIEKIIAGDMRAFQALVEDYQRLVCHVVFRMVHNEEDREEICQDVFVKVYQNLSKFEQKSKLSTWIGRIAYNTCINYLKKKKVPLYEDLAPAESGESGSSQNKGSYLDRVPGGAKLADETVSDKEMYKFLHEEIAQLPVQFTQNGRALCYQDDPGRIAIQAVDQFEVAGIGANVPQAFDQAETQPAAAVHRQAGGFIDNQQVIVLVENLPLNLLRLLV